LADLERKVLGLRRVGDVPGAEIPGRYVGYLRGGDARLLEPVLEHNRLDLVSLGLLAGLACRFVRDGALATAGAAQALGLGRVYEKVGRIDSAITCYQSAAGADQTEGCEASWGHGSGDGARALAFGRLARLYRRQRRHGDAAEAWARLLSLSRVPDPLRHEASVALAVHHEHRLRDLAAAQRFARRALEPRPPASGREAVQHRLTRLGRKIEATCAGTERGFLQDS